MSLHTHAHTLSYHNWSPMDVKKASIYLSTSMSVHLAIVLSLFKQTNNVDNDIILLLVINKQYLLGIPSLLILYYSLLMLTMLYLGHILAIDLS